MIEDYWKDIESGRETLIFRLNKIGDLIDSVNCNWIHFNTPDDNKKTKEVFDKYNVRSKVL